MNIHWEVVHLRKSIPLILVQLVVVPQEEKEADLDEQLVKAFFLVILLEQTLVYRYICV